MSTLAVLLLVLVALCHATPAGASVQAPGPGTERRQTSDSGYHWVSTWTAVTQLLGSSDLPPAPFSTAPVFKDATLRETLRITVGADRFRILVSNVFGGSELSIAAASLALTAGNKLGVSGIDANSLIGLTFNGGSRSVTVAKGATIYTDPVNVTLAAQTTVSLSMYLQTGQAGTALTGHSASQTSSFFVSGNKVNATSLTGAASGKHWYFTAAIEGWMPQTTSALVVLGDSLTDGYGSTDNANNRWPDDLFRRMQAAGWNNLTVCNEGAGGNTILTGGTGPPLLTRYKRDAIQQAGAKYVLVFEGTNDISFYTSNQAALAQADKLIAALYQIASDCKKAGLKAIGATIMPFSSTVYRELTRTTVNNWILNNGSFDAVLDFAKFVANPNNASQLNPAYDYGDHLHMNPAGYQALANAIPLTVFA